MPLAEIDPLTLAGITAAAHAQTDEPEVRNNLVWWALYGNEFGFYRNTRDNQSVWSVDENDSHLWTDRAGNLVLDREGRPVRLRRVTWKRFRMRRHEWMERFVRIKNKRKQIVPLVLNPQQRRLEARVLRRERKGLPVRVRILKVRQIGISTYGQGFAWERGLRHGQFRSLLIAHRKKTASAIFQKIHLMRKRMPREGTRCWEFDTPHKSRSEVAVGAPMECVVDIDSAEVEEPGHGETIDFLHMTETSRWKDAETKAKGLEQTIPDEPFTYIFDESTANGESGYFYTGFWRGYAERGNIGAALEAEDDEHELDWESIFFPWFEFAEYRWSYVHRKPLPEALAQRILANLDAREERLLQQRFFERGTGWRSVDVDQLAWRRETKVKKCNDSWMVFDEQYPGFPEDAFKATGFGAFDPDHIREAMARCTEPVFVGDLVESAVGTEHVVEELERFANE